MVARRKRVLNEVTGEHMFYVLSKTGTMHALEKIKEYREKYLRAFLPRYTGTFLGIIERLFPQETLAICRAARGHVQEFNYGHDPYIRFWQGDGGLRVNEKLWETHGMVKPQLNKKESMEELLPDVWEYSQMACEMYNQWNVVEEVFHAINNQNITPTAMFDAIPWAATFCEASFVQAYKDKRTIKEATVPASLLDKMRKASVMMGAAVLLPEPPKDKPKPTVHATRMGSGYNVSLFYE